MARKRKKRRAVNWSPVLGALLTVNVILGLLFSPVTSVTRARVVGAQPHDVKRLTSLLQSLRGTPSSRIQVGQFESQVLAQRDVYSADLSRNLFGSAVVHLKYRRPVAQLVNMPHAYLDDQGVLYNTPETFANIRQLNLAPEYSQAVASFAQGWPSGVIAKLCTDLDSFEQLRGAVVYLDTTGRLKLSKENIGEVNLGGTEALEEKLRKLRQFLLERPDLMTKVRTLDLTDPARPTATPLNVSS